MRRARGTQPFSPHAPHVGAISTFLDRRARWPKVRRRAIAKYANRRRPSPSPPRRHLRFWRRRKITKNSGRHSSARLNRVTKETVHLVQAFVAGRGKGLKSEPPIACKSAEEACRRAERLSASGSAWSRSRPRRILIWATTTRARPSCSRLAKSRRRSTKCEGGLARPLGQGGVASRGGERLTLSTSSITEWPWPNPDETA